MVSFVVAGLRNWLRDWLLACSLRGGSPSLYIQYYISRSQVLILRTFALYPFVTTRRLLPFPTARYEESHCHNLNHYYIHLYVWQRDREQTLITRRATRNTGHWHLAYLPLLLLRAIRQHTTYIQTSICEIAPLSTLITTISRVNPIEAQRGCQYNDTMTR